MRIFITGASGFIGEHLVRTALNSGYKVTALCRGTTALDSIATGGCKVLKKSLSDVIASDLTGHDCLVHLAAIGVSPRQASWEDLLKVNICDAARVLSAAAEVNLKRWVVTGSFAEYGRSAEKYDSIPSDAALEPCFAYAASKAAGSILFRSLAEVHNARLSYLRLFSVFGDGQHQSNLWPSLKNAALAGEDFAMTPGEQIRDFIAVEEVVEHLLAACLDDSVKPGMPTVRNCGTGRPQTVRAFCEHWWQHWNATGKLKFGALSYRPGEVMRYVPQV